MIKVNDRVALRIHRYIRMDETTPPEVPLSEHLESEVDSEALVKPLASESTGPGVSVTYDIAHSVSYQVPVLYVQLKAPAERRQLSADMLYDLLTPTTHRKTVQESGTIGAITMTASIRPSGPSLYGGLNCAGSSLYRASRLSRPSMHDERSHADSRRWISN